MHSIKHALTLLLFSFVIASCTGFGAREPAAGEGVATSVAVPTESRTETPAATGTAIDPGPVPTEVIQTEPPPVEMTPTPVPAATSTASAFTLAGLVYRTQEGLWQIEAGGEAILLSQRPDMDLSPDGTQGLFIEDGDVWIVDLPAGEPRNVTAGSGREHVNAQWWPARPQTLVLGSWGEGDQGPNTGRLTLVQTDGSNYRIVHPQGELSYALPAPAPDGETIAYDEAGQAMLYHEDSGAVPFDAPAYNLPQDAEVWRIASPSWSPDGNRLAWAMALIGGGFGDAGAAEALVGVFDLQAKTAQLLHPFQPVGRGGWFAAPRWSPDGQWLTFLVESQEQTEYGLWALASDGSAEQQLNQGTSAQGWWAPPERSPTPQLLLGVSDPEGGVNYALVAPPTWQPEPVELPPQAMVSEWRPLP